MYLYTSNIPYVCDVFMHMYSVYSCALLGHLVFFSSFFPGLSPLWRDGDETEGQREENICYVCILLFRPASLAGRQFFFLSLALLSNRRSKQSKTCTSQGAALFLLVILFGRAWGTNCCVESTGRKNERMSNHLRTFLSLFGLNWVEVGLGGLSYEGRPCATTLLDKERKRVKTSNSGCNFKLMTI